MCRYSLALGESNPTAIDHTVRPWRAVVVVVLAARPAEAARTPTHVGVNVVHTHASTLTRTAQALIDLSLAVLALEPRRARAQRRTNGLAMVSGALCTVLAQLCTRYHTMHITDHRLNQATVDTPENAHHRPQTQLGHC